MSIRNSITAAEQDRIVALLRTKPILDVRKLTGRSYITLARIARAAL